MPTERFFHLPEEKKKRIIRASLNEFARVPFDEISINRIVQGAEIARGSFYQYFEDKYDLQKFLLEDFRQQLEIRVREYLQQKKGDLFCFFNDALKEIVRVGMRCEFRVVCKNAFAQLKYGESCCKNTPFGDDMEKLYTEITGHMKKEYYQDYSAEELLLVWEILLQLIKEAVVRIFLFEEPEEPVIEKYQKKIAIIEAGMKAEERRNA